jgi:hypothetical protein
MRWSKQCSDFARNGATDQGCIETNAFRMG